MSAEGAQAAAPGLSLSMNMAAGMPPLFGGEQGMLESVSTLAQREMVAWKEDAAAVSGTGTYEAHLWDNRCRREGQPRKGRQCICNLKVCFFFYQYV